MLTVLTAPAAILIAGTASLTLLCDVQICSRRRTKQRLVRLSTGCFQKRKITISKMVGVAGWAPGLNLSRSCGKGNKDSTATTFFAVQNASMFTSAPTPNTLAHIGVPLSGGNVTYILRKAIELEGPDLIPQHDIYHIKKERMINYVYISSYHVSYDSRRRGDLDPADSRRNGSVAYRPRYYALKDTRRERLPYSQIYTPSRVFQDMYNCAQQKTCRPL